MKALDRKLFRDLLDLRGQVLTIALVVACGISSYVTMRTAYDSLLHSRDRYYTEQRFADVFASLKRAPRPVQARLEAVAGVAQLDTRVVEHVLVPLPGVTRPASGTVVSYDARARGSRLNDVYIKRGRELDPARHDEVLLLEGFADAHGLGPGDRIEAVINGTLRPLRIAGIALSPEYVMTLAPGQISYDPASVPVVWMNEGALQAAFRMEGGFNHVAIRLEPHANLARVLAQVDAELSPYGGFGAVGRAKQPSNYMLESELTQLDMMASFVPYLFLFVAAILVNVVLSRVVQLQRSQIATLKAVGYRDGAIGLHYLKLVAVIVVAGAVLGVALGAWLGRAMTEFYTGNFFRFPHPDYRLEPRTVAFAVGISLGSAVAGAWWAVRGVMALPPAEAMLPPAPARYRRSILERLGLWPWLGPAGRMIWREVTRRPLRLALSALGISLATGLIVLARSMWDATDHLIDVQFHRSMREDVTVTFARPVAQGAVAGLEHLPGVHSAEGLRSVPARFEAGHRFRDSVLMGYPSPTRLRRLLDVEAVAHEPAEGGVMLTRKLGELLELRAGDRVTVKLREGEWATRELVVSGFIDEPFGLQGHMRLEDLNRLMRDSGMVNTALLEVDPELVPSIERRLKQMPWVAGVASPGDFKRQFDEQSAAIISLITFIMTAFSATIAIGVIYNNARVALSQRTRDLASLRVLGFTRREVAGILFGEQAIQVALAIPLGLIIGYWLSNLMMSQADPEMYRFHVVVSERTYLFAVAVTLSSALVSGLILRRKIDRLDLIGVLKTRE